MLFEIIGIRAKEAIKSSAKTGEGVEELLRLLINKLPAPKANDNEPLQVLVIDSWYDKYLGIITLVRVKNGSLQVGKKIQMMSKTQKRRRRLFQEKDGGKGSLNSIRKTGFWQDLVTNFLFFVQPLQCLPVAQKTKIVCNSDPVPDQNPFLG